MTPWLAPFYFSAMTTRRYNYIAWKEAGTWTAHSPAVPGVYGLGKTRKAAESDLASGLRELSGYLKEIGEKMPRPFALGAGVVEV